LIHDILLPFYYFEDVSQDYLWIYLTAKIFGVIAKSRFSTAALHDLNANTNTLPDRPCKKGGWWHTGILQKGLFVLSSKNRAAKSWDCPAHRLEDTIPSLGFNG